MRPRVAIGGMAIESSTFSPHRSGAADFTVVRGSTLLAKYDVLPSSVEWIGLVHARALPGGAVERAFYESIKTELLAGLRAALPLDGVYLDIHGAMTVAGSTDAEGDLAAAIREVVGPACLISASMDPHGNMSRRLIGALDLATSHRMSPHDDAPLTRRRAIANLVGCLEGGVRPLRAWVRVPVLLPGERACTRDEPARSIYGSLSEIERRDGIIDAAVWIGYAWADEPRCSAAVVVTGTDEAAIKSAARELGRRYWDARTAFDFSVPAADAEACIASGLSRTARPFFISDSGDNPTAGGAGDASYMLERLLADPRIASGQATAIWASCADPAGVAACVRAGAGAEVDVPVGGAFGSPWSTRLQGRVERLRAADPVGGDIAVVAAGGVRAVLTTRRKPYHYLRDFTDLGLDPAAHDLTVVKIGYLVPDLFAAARGWMIALTPGGVDQHITRLPYRALARPIYPLDPDMADPELEPLITRS
ncbi:MAG TPA: M81 family metallopeptidase [Candidatus Saccharimonadales bacterium]|nr:M81 family metallopeptidase [Candidatus Saccharimonadales bacterium]